MSLRGFHILFIVLAIVLSTVFGGWCFTVPNPQDSAWYVPLGCLSLAIAGGLALYLPWFLKKARRLHLGEDRS